jgi:dTMP kinase
LSGFFISFEGIEGCGKSTQARLLAGALKSKGYSVVLTREPGNGEIGDKIRQILLSTETQKLDPLTEMLLLAADRNQHVKDVIKPALENGFIVICDRYLDSSVAYQSFGRGIPIQKVKTLNEMATSGLKPHLTFIIDLDVRDSLLRSRDRLLQQEMFQKEGRFEEESLNFHCAVRTGYLKLSRRHPERMVVIDGTSDIQSIFERIQAAVDARLKNLNLPMGFGSND